MKERGSIFSERLQQIGENIKPQRLVERWRGWSNLTKEAIGTGLLATGLGLLVYSILGPEVAVLGRKGLIVASGLIAAGGIGLVQSYAPKATEDLLKIRRDLKKPIRIKFS